MFNYKTLSESSKVYENNLPIDELTPKGSEHYMYNYLEYNDEMHSLDVDFSCDYYRELCNAHARGDNSLILSEASLEKFKETFIKMIQKIIDFINKIVDTITQRHRRITKEFEEEKKKTKGFSFKFDKSAFDDWFNRFWSSYSAENPDASRKTEYYNRSESAKQTSASIDDEKYLFIVHTYPDPSTIDSNDPRAAIRDLITAVEDICSGKDYIADEASLKVSYKALGRIIKSSRNTFKESINSSESFRQYIKSDVCYLEKQTMTVKEWRTDVLRTVSDLGNNFVESKVNLIIEDLNKCKESIRRTNGTLTADQIRNANTLISYIKDVVDSWVWYINYIMSMHTKKLKYILSMCDRITNDIFRGRTVNESGFIHGEEFDSDTLFANEDLRDFNRTEWLDLRLTTECYMYKYTLTEGRRKVALKEALILTDDEPNKVARINAMREEANANVKQTLQNIINTIAELINKFMNTAKDRVGLNAAYIKRNADVLKPEVKADWKITSRGDILAGMYRVQDNLNIVPFDFDSRADDYQSKEVFFEKRILPWLNKSSSFAKRDPKWQQDMGIANYCKIYYGAAMPDNQYEPVTITGAEIQQNQENILKFLQQTNVIGSVKADLDKVSQNAKNIRMDDNKTNTEDRAGAAAKANAQSPSGNAATKQESAYSTLYGMVLTEVQIDAGEQTNEDKGQDSGKDRETAAKVYLNAYKDVVLSKATAAEFVIRELMAIEKAHARSHMSAERRQKETQEEKENTNNNQNQNG